MTGLRAVPDNPDTVELTRQRDQARDIAAALEAENAELTAKNAALKRRIDRAVTVLRGNASSYRVVDRLAAALSPEET